MKFNDNIHISLHSETTLRALKSLTQSYTPSERIMEFMHIFTNIMNVTIDVALTRNLTSENAISAEVYPLVKDLPIPSYYIPPAITKAIAMVKTYRKNVRRRMKKGKRSKKIAVKCSNPNRAEENQDQRKPKEIRKPHVENSILATHYGFRIVGDELIIPVAKQRYGREHERIKLNRYVSSKMGKEGIHARSFVLTLQGLSITIEKNPGQIECDSTVGMDRNIRNVTVGNELSQEIYDLSAIPEIKRRYRNKISHFTRDDVRIMKKIRGKYGRREKNRTDAILHNTSRKIVDCGVTRKEAPVLEDIRYLNSMTFRGDYRGPDHRFLMHNSFPYARLANMIKYKAVWEGLPVIQLTREETRGTSIQCSECGSRTRMSGRKLHCESCDVWIDRDINACINQAKKGRIRLMRSIREEKGPPVEAVKHSRNAEQMAGSQILSTKI